MLKFEARLGNTEPVKREGEIAAEWRGEVGGGGRGERRGNLNAVCRKMDTIRDHHIKQNKSDSES